LAGYLLFHTALPARRDAGCADMLCGE